MSIRTLFRRRSAASVLSPVIYHDGGRFLVYLPETNVWGEGITVESAYAEFQRRLSATSTDGAGHMPFPRALAEARWRRWRNGIFVAILIIALAYAQMAVLIGIPLRIAGSFSRVPVLLDYAASKLTKLTPDEKQQFAASIGRLRKAVTDLWDAEPQASSQDCYPSTRDVRNTR